jgi:hypothetical protein
MPYLTLWPHGEHQPTVSTLNALDGFITSNMAIVPTNDGSIDAYAAGLTQLILDISGYFAPYRRQTRLQSGVAGAAVGFAVRRGQVRWRT